MRLTENGLIRINFRDDLPSVNRRLRCNFRCSYCLQDEVEQFSFTREHFERAKTIWNHLANIDDNILVKVNFDGETMIDRWAKECCYYICRLPNVKVLEIITNNSVNPHAYLDKFDIKKISFNCSFHPEQMSYEKFLRNILAIKDAGCPVFATMVVTPKLVEKLPEYYQKFAQQGICLKPLLLLGNYQGGVSPLLRPIHRWFKKMIDNGVSYPKAYTTREIETIKKFYYSDLEFKYQKGENPKGLPCYAGVDMINVYMDGTVLRCFGGEIGTIEDLVNGRVKLANKPYDCFTNECQCPTHMIFLKEFRERYPLCEKFADHYHCDKPEVVQMICNCHV
jgi:sulfatase maturation enzyme AslB (radical SAM superfamily)